MTDHPSVGSPAEPSVQVDPRLLELLVCPLTKTTLAYDAARQELISRAARLAFSTTSGKAETRAGTGSAPP